MEPKRIGFDARFISDRYHGIGRYSFNLLEALSRVAQDRNFVVFTGKDADTRFDWETFQHRANIELQAGPWPLYWPQEQLRWPEMLKRHHVDLFHSPYFVAPLFTSAEIAKIITVHDLIFDRHPEYLPNFWTRSYYRTLMLRGTQRSVRVLTVSEATAKDLSTYYPASLEKTRVVAEGIDATFRPIPDREALEGIRQKYNLPNKFLLSIGARRPHKNLTSLVSAFSRLVAKIPYHLVFAGPADRRFRDDTRIEVDRNGLNHRVHFLEWVCEEDLPGLYNLADLVVLPSLLEGFGLPALEAMACGIPVIAANNSSFPEVLGEAGFLVDASETAALAEAIEKCFMQPSLRSRLAAAGLERAKHFNWERAAAGIIKNYDEVLG